jgi:ParB/Sulfiredoxin domain
MAELENAPLEGEPVDNTENTEAGNPDAIGATEGAPVTTMPIADIDIKVGDRHRHDLGDISGLAASIAEIGLPHPVVIRPDGTLIAGERRLAALKRDYGNVDDADCDWVVHSVAARFGLTDSLARVVCEQARIGGSGDRSTAGKTA